MFSPRQVGAGTATTFQVLSHFSSRASSGLKHSIGLYSQIFQWTGPTCPCEQPWWALLNAKELSSFTLNFCGPPPTLDVLCYGLTLAHNLAANDGKILNCDTNHNHSLEYLGMAYEEFDVDKKSINKGDLLAQNL